MVMGRKRDVVVVGELIREHFAELFEYLWSLQNEPDKQMAPVTQMIHGKDEVIDKDTTVVVDWNKSAKKEVVWKHGSEGDIILKDFSWLMLVASECFMRGALYLSEEYLQAGVASPVQASEMITKISNLLIGMSEINLLRVETASYLQRHFPHANISPDNLHSLPENIKRVGRSFLRNKFGNSIKASDRIKEVFRKPKKSSARHEPSFNLPR
jgi:hypothetical protein